MKVIVEDGGGNRREEPFVKFIMRRVGESSVRYVLSRLIKILFRKNFINESDIRELFLTYTGSDKLVDIEGD